MNIKFSKKGDISINTIVVAAIAIMVLLVIILIFTTNIRKPANEVENVNEDRGSMIDGITERLDCKSSIGDCVESESACKEIDKNRKISSLYKCPDSMPPYCCVK